MKSLKHTPFYVRVGTAMYLLTWIVFFCIGWLPANPSTKHVTIVLVISILVACLGAFIGDKLKNRGARQ